MLPNKTTPNSDPQRPTNNKPYEIKKLAAGKRRARSIWQRTQAPDSRRKYNRISNKTKSKLQELRNEQFKKYVSNLKRQNNSIWKPIKKRKQHHPQYANIQHLRDHGQKATRKKLNYLQNIFPKFSLHIIMIRIRKWNKSSYTHSIARTP